MIISSSGTTVPGSPIRPEFLKATVYLPPAFVTHHPDLHSHIIDMVQHYIETVGVRTVTMWTQRARRDLKYSLTQRGNPHQNAYFNAISIPEHNSAHYTFIGQPYRIVQDPSTTSVRAPSPDGSVASYDFGEDPDPVTLLNIDLQQENGELQDQIKTLQHKITDLEQQVIFGNKLHLSMSTNLKHAQDRIILLEGQILEGQILGTIAETTPVSTPVRNVVATSFLRHGQVPLTPSRVWPSRAHTPEYRSPNPHTPDMSRHHGARSFQGLGSPSTSRIVDDFAPVYEPLLQHYINLYNLQHLAAPLDLIFNYTPAENRTRELLKLGLNEDVCDSLARAMTLDNGMGLSSSGKDNIE